MEREEWKRRYCKRLMDRAGLTAEEAEDNFDAGDDYDFESSPEHEADEELSYWAQDSVVR